MKKVLFITANPNNATVSYSKAVGEAFLASYKEANPSDEVVVVDLFETMVPMIDSEVMEAWGQFMQGTPFSSLSSSQQEKITAMNTNVAQFIEADRYIFVTPMWNFSYPPVVKAYLDNVAVAGKTFKYTENGPVGLLEGKKAFHIQATGGVYTEGPGTSLDFGRQHLQALLSFLGVTDFSSLAVEGMAAAPQRAEEIKETAIAAAIEAAKQF